MQPDFGFRVAIHGDNGATASVHEIPEGTQGVNDVWTFGAGAVDRAGVGGEPNRAVQGFPSSISCRSRSSWTRFGQGARRP